MGGERDAFESNLGFRHSTERVRIVGLHAGYIPGVWPGDRVHEIGLAGH